MAGSGNEAGRDSVKNAILIAGPTASGKSALAVDLARRNGGVIVNADSMQVYSVLDILTARPKADDLALAPHFLYGHVHPSVAYSTGAYLRDVKRLLREGVLSGRPVIFVGGTGLYFRALAEGMSEMPEIPPAVRAHWRQALRERGSVELHAILVQRDAAAASTLKPGDSQRIVRALEVLEASGRSILVWQAERGPPLVDPHSTQFFVIEPERLGLIRRIEQRFDAMIEQGAPREVEALYALRLASTLPAMKAIGVRELHAAMAGEMSFAEAIERAKAATRQYAKRQATWFRHQFDARWKRLSGTETLMP